MNLQTQIQIKKETRNAINYNSKLLLLGSCFSDNIGNKLAYYKFKSNQNPFGILFQPKAIETLITNAINEKVYTNENLIFQNERWHCFDAHSNLSSVDKNELLSNLNSAILSTNKNLQEASHLIITLGTSWVYRFIETDIVVANCHKIPQKKFLKELLTIDEITQSLEGIIELIKTINLNINVLFTVSPVRHLKDGFIENTQSKSHLIAAIHNIIDERKNTFYFPSYEIMMDELRDYRFYNEDMVHPNNIAINYIWSKFSEAWFSDDSKETMLKVETIQKGLAHRPFNEKSELHQQFLKKIEQKIIKLKEEIPFINFD